MKTLKLKGTVVIITFFALFNFSYGQSVKSTFIGSHGYLIEGSNKKVALDAHIYWEGNNWGYIKPPLAIKEKIEEAEEPFNNIDLILISHAHTDHFNSLMIEKSMNLNPNAFIIATPEIYTQISSEAVDFSTFKDRMWAPELPNYESIDTVINGISLTFTNIVHGESMSLFVYSFVIDNIRFTQLNGWNSVTGQMYDTLGFNKQRADVAFLSYDYLLDNAKLELFKNHINPVFSTITHIDGAGPTLYKSIQNVIDQIGNDYPMNLRYVPMEQLLFTKNENGLVVTDQNRAPIQLQAIPDTVIYLDNVFNFSIPVDNFSDPDGNQLYFSALKSTGQELPEWLSFDPMTLTFSGTPTEKETLYLNLFTTDSVGAQITDPFKITVKEFVSNKENPGSRLNIYPTPAKNILFIENSNQSYTYSLFDLSGKELYNAKTNLNNIDISQLKKGIYLINIVMDKKEFCEKIVIE